LQRLARFLDQKIRLTFRAYEKRDVYDVLPELQHVPFFYAV
jgi:hypothetical protein